MLQIVNDDMPFLVDSVTMALSELGIGVHVLGHPVVRFQRDQAGNLDGVGEGEAGVADPSRDRPAAGRGDGADRTGDPQACSPTCAQIVVDWSAMRAKMLQIADELADAHDAGVADAGRTEAQEFLRWAADNHFTFLGYREYQVVEQGGETKC